MIVSKIEDQWLKVYIDEVLHLSVYIPHVVSYVAWIEGEGWFGIYIHCTGLKDPVYLEYNKQELWLEMIKALDNNI